MQTGVRGSKMTGVNAVASSFAWPFRGRWQPAWAVGILALVLLPLGVVPLLGYAVDCVREAAADGPPPWRPRPRLLGDGLAVLAAVVAVAAPFVLVAMPIAAALRSPELWHSTGVMVSVEAGLAAALVVALPWGLVMLLVMPHALARYSASGAVRDLFDYPASLRAVSRDFATWNVSAAAIVTAWAAGIAAVALCCVGLVPGTLYAILVSAHATAALSPEGSRTSAR